MEAAVLLPYEGLHTDRWSHWELALDPDAYLQPKPIHRAEAVYNPYDVYSLRKGLQSFASGRIVSQ